MDHPAFDQFIVESYEQLPAWVRDKIKNVALLVEDEPSPAERRAQGLRRNETLLGLYKGIPLSARGENYGVGMTLPDTITLYRRPILDAAQDELEHEVQNTVLHNDFVNRYKGENNDLRNRYEGIVKRVIAETIWHEFAHHFGMDEHEVRSREKGRGLL